MLFLFDFIPTASAQQTLSASDTALKLQASSATVSSADETIWDAGLEAAIVIGVFCLCSLFFQVFGQRKRKPPRERTGKADDAGGDQLKGDAKLHAMARDSRAQPSASKAPRSSHATNMDAIATLVRSGRASDLPRCMDKLMSNCSSKTSEHQAEFATQQLLVALRACAAAHRFREGLAAYDHVASRLGEGDGALWSMLLYTAVEAGRCELGPEFFQKLCTQSAPCSHDFVNLVRALVHCGDLQGLQKILKDLHRKDYEIDCFARNKALAACAAADSSASCLAFAEAIARDASLDGIGYNTLMKLQAKAGPSQLSRIFELLDEMTSKGLQATEVTFGILLDACVGAGDLDRAKKVFADLSSSGLHLNVVHCTTLLKGLIAAGRLDEASNVLDEMLSTPGAKPDLIAYTTLVKAYADRGNVAASISVLEKMKKQRVQPDEIVFNGVLGGCCAGPSEPSATLRTFDWLISQGLKPSTMTFSILLKALLLGGAWDTALSILEKSAARFNIEPEARLYAQISSAALKAHRGASALEAFTQMLHRTSQRGETLDPSISGRILRQCNVCGDYDTAKKMQEALRRIDGKVEKSPQESAFRKPRLSSISR